MVEEYWIKESAICRYGTTMDDLVKMAGTWKWPRGDDEV